MGKRKYDDEFKRNVVTKVLNGQSAAGVSREIGVNEGLIHTAVGNEQLSIMATGSIRELN